MTNTNCYHTSLELTPQGMQLLARLTLMARNAARAAGRPRPTQSQIVEAAITVAAAVKGIGIEARPYQAGERTGK